MRVPISESVQRRPFLASLGAILGAFVLRAAKVDSDLRAADLGPEPAIELLEEEAISVGFEPMIGQIMLLPYNFEPRGWTQCNGRELLISQNPALYSLLGTRFGGDGRRTFRIPSLKPPVGGLGYLIALTGQFPSRN